VSGRQATLYGQVIEHFAETFATFDDSMVVHWQRRTGMITSEQVRKWRRDPVAFVREALIDPETDRPFDLYPAEEMFIKEALTVTEDGRLPYPELVFSGPKKTGKTALAGIFKIYIVVVLGGKFAEGYCCANDQDQSQGRVFQAVVRILEASPIFAGSYKLSGNTITFLSTGATIQALASDYAGNAGANPNITSFDELWAFTSERSRRLWDEMVPPPTRKVACRLTVTYAGFEGESELLDELYKRGLQGEEIAPALYRQPGMLMFWSHEPVAPWQTPEWIEQMRRTLRKNAFTRIIENRWVSSESDFVDMEWWDECVSPETRPAISDTALPVWVGVDASVKRDSTAIVACTYDQKLNRVRLVWHRVFQPSVKDPLDFEATIEATLLDLKNKFRLREVRFDPYQLIHTSQRLKKAGVPMVEFPQTQPNLTEASQNLYDLVKGRNLIAYADADIRLAVNRAVAKETPRGWRIAKEKQSHKIDVVVALAQAALGAVQGRTKSGVAKRVNVFTGEVLWSSDGSHEAQRPSEDMQRRIEKYFENPDEVTAAGLFHSSHVERDPERAAWAKAKQISLTR
jgi:hypothetical protein